MVVRHVYYRINGKTDGCKTCILQNQRKDKCLNQCVSLFLRSTSCRQWAVSFRSQLTSSLESHNTLDLLASGSQVNYCHLLVGYFDQYSFLNDYSMYI